MIFLILFAFLAGIVTVLSPCILPVLPIVLAGSLSQSKRKPLGIITGFIFSFTFFTLALSTIVKATGLPAEVLRNISVVIILFFGISLLIPKTQILLEILFSKLANRVPTQTQPQESYWSGILIGVSLGLIWTPCVGPIIASVITLAATSTVTLGSIFITLAYSLGTAIPMFVIIYSGQTLLQKHPGLLANTANIQKIFGVLMIVVAIGIYFQLDRNFQNYVLQKFPQYGAGLTQIENNTYVKQGLNGLKDTQSDVNNKKAPEIIAGGSWINSRPLKLSDLKGKVVLLDFWTYSCINCIRTLPYLKAWNEKYADKGLVIIGVHSPEFEFEKNLSNVQKAVKDFGIKYPVVQDNNFDTWRAYNNQYWPAEYLIDKDGNIAESHFGEGDYDATEKKIQELLNQGASQKITAPINNPTYNIDAQSPETYLGYKRQEYLDPSQTSTNDQLTTFVQPAHIQPNTFALSGDWIINSESANPQSGAKLFLNFTAKNVYLVMNAKSGTNGQVKVLMDNQVVSGKNSMNTIQQGILNVKANTIYQLIELQKPGQHLLELDFQDSNIELFAFTFG